ncbi:MAG TPA: hypothetical protein VGJ73_10435 [Verrucomicrobiae bacterium]|jgi:uncharacterized protein involved in exopolysaccharide biosynthesis
MPQVFEEIREQIHEIRNMVAPFDLRLANLDAQITASRALLEQRTATLETKVMATSFRLDEQGGKIEAILDNYGQLSARVHKLETEMKLFPKQEPAKASSVHADKTNPTIAPPQSSAS